MPARKHTQWLAEPSIEYVDSRIYSDWGIFNQEQEKIFKKCWIPLCHESELENHLDFRSSSIAGSKVAMIRDKDRIVAVEHNFQSMPVSGNLASDGGYDHWNCPSLPCEVKFGGMVWVTLNSKPVQDVEGWAAGAFDVIRPALDRDCQWTRLVLGWPPCLTQEEITDKLKEMDCKTYSWNFLNIPYCKEIK